MSPSALLLSLLAAWCLCAHAQGKRACSDRCCSFVEGFPVRLKELRASFSKIRDYYVANDELESALLDDNILHYFKSPYGCHAMDNILRFYLDTVLPTAVTTGLTRPGEGNTEDFKTPIDSIGSILLGLKKDIIQCRNYFSCKRPFDIKELISSYNKMENKGLYKAMGELDLFFNYIEAYMVSNRRQQ